jgi:heptaprenyl diphosphate synthase
MSTKKIAQLGLLIALAFVFSYVEFLIPVNLGIPGAKLGLANLVIMVALYTIGERNAFALSMLRILLVGFTFGNMAMMMYSFAGALLSFLVMLLAKKTGKLSVIGVSVLGGVFHNIGQILVAIVVLETKSLIYYLPVLLLAGTISGIAIGVLGGLVTKRIFHVI